MVFLEYFLVYLFSDPSSCAEGFVGVEANGSTIGDGLFGVEASGSIIEDGLFGVGPNESIVGVGFGGVVLGDCGCTVVFSIDTSILEIIGVFLSPPDSVVNLGIFGVCLLGVFFNVPNSADVFVGVFLNVPNEGVFLSPPDSVVIFEISGVCLLGVLDILLGVNDSFNLSAKFLVLNLFDAFFIY